MSRLAARKAARAQKNKALREQFEQSASQSKKSYDDPRFWSCARNDAGIGSAVIRFLPPTDDDIEYFVNELGMDENSVPFYAKQHQHGFKGENGKWFINNCPTSVVMGECPVCNANSELVESWGGWDAVDDNHSEKKLVRNRKRKETYYANVLIIEDKANPENEGKVKLFRYGAAIQKQIMGMLIPEFEDEESIDVSDYWDGCDFRLKIVKKNGYTNYDKSSWSEPHAIADTDDEIEEILNRQHNVTEFIAKDKYKSFEDLEKEFARVTGSAPSRSKPRSQDDDENMPEPAPESSDETVDEPAPKRTRKPKNPEENSAVSNDDYFNSLLDD